MLIIYLLNIASSPALLDTSHPHVNFTAKHGQLAQAFWSRVCGILRALVTALAFAHASAKPFHLYAGARPTAA